MNRIFLVILCGNILSACASKPIHLPMQPISSPPLGQERTTQLGDRLLMQASGYKTDILQVETMDPFGGLYYKRVLLSGAGFQYFYQFRPKSGGFEERVWYGD